MSDGPARPGSYVPAPGTYLYTFQVWPDSDRAQPAALYDLFRALNKRITMEYTQLEFEQFREGLRRAGLTLRDVTRVLYVKPEVVL